MSLSAAARKLTFLLLAAVTVVFVGFAVANRQFVHVSFFPLPYAADMPQFLFAMLCFALGAVVGWGLIALKLSRSNRRLKSEHRQAEALRNELSGWRSQAEDGEAVPPALPKM